MLFRDKTSFNDFKESEEKIATNILADRLAKLEQEGFIEVCTFCRTRHCLSTA